MQHWPRVSTILKVLDNAYSEVPEAVLAKAAERGERLHRLCLTYLASKGGLCEEPSEISKDDRLAYDAFAKWVDVNAVTPIAVEQESTCTQYKYRGTPDALVIYKDCHTILDLKFTASILRINHVQVQAYGYLDLYAGHKKYLLIHIAPKTGAIKFITVKKDPRDWAAFLSARSVWEWRQV